MKVYRLLLAVIFVSLLLMAWKPNKYSKIKPDEVSEIKSSGKNLIQKVLRCETFDDLLKLENEFKGKITLPIYQIFTYDLKRSNIRTV